MPYFLIVLEAFKYFLLHLETCVIPELFFVQNLKHIDLLFCAYLLPDCDLHRGFHYFQNIFARDFVKIFKDSSLTKAYDIWPQTNCLILVNKLGRYRENLLLHLFCKILKNTYALILRQALPEFIRLLRGVLFWFWCYFIFS